MLDNTTDGAMPEEWERRSPAHPADPGLFDRAKPAADVALRPGGPENP